MDTLAIREFAADAGRESHARLAATLAAAKVLFGAAVYAALAAWFAWKGPREQAELGLIIGATVLTALLISYSIDWFQARLRIARVFAPVALLNSLFAAAAVLLVPRLHDLRLQVALFPALELVSGLVLLVWLRREDLLAPPLFAFDRVRALALQSLPIAMTGLLIMFYSRLDVLVIAAKSGHEAVGQYGIAFRLTEPVHIAAGAFALSIFSRFSAWFRNPAGISLAGKALRYVSVAMVYGITCALTLGLLAPPVIERFFPQYAASIPLLRLLALTLVFRSLNATLAAIVQGAGRFYVLTGLTAVALASLFVSLQVLVGRFGPSGAAYSLLLVEGCAVVLQAIVVVRLVTGRGPAPSGGAPSP
jgi:O-antigen/teichoic acid export membrane protein